jgi:hypothetical protein
MANIVPQYDPSMALTGGWPFSQVAGDGNLGNVATAEISAREGYSGFLPTIPTHFIFRALTLGASLLACFCESCLSHQVRVSQKSPPQKP